MQHVTGSSSSEMFQSDDDDVGGLVLQLCGIATDMRTNLYVKCISKPETTLYCTGDDISRYTGPRRKNGA